MYKYYKRPIYIFYKQNVCIKVHAACLMLTYPDQCLYHKMNNRKVSSLWNIFWSLSYMVTL